MREVWGIGKRLWGKDWKRRIWLYFSMDGNGVWNGDMGLEGKEGNRRDSRKVFEMDTRIGMENAGIYDQRRNKKSDDEGKGRKKSLEV